MVRYEAYLQELTYLLALGKSAIDVCQIDLKLEQKPTLGHLLL